MPPSDPLVAKLKSQIRALRETLDPKVLTFVQQKLTGEEPYDKEAAKEAINLFLKGRTANPAFLKKLKMKLAQEGATSPGRDAEARPDGTTPPAPRQQPKK